MKLKTFLMVVLAFVMNDTTSSAQKKELQTEKDGFEWYKTYKNDDNASYGRFYGAEDLYGNMILPTEFDFVYYSPDRDVYYDTFGGFKIKKDGYKGWYTRGGKCIIPYNRGYRDIFKYTVEDDDDKQGTHYQFSTDNGCGLCDRNGKEVFFSNVSTDGPYLSSFTIEGGKKLYYYKFIEKKNGEVLYLYTDTNGKIVIHPQKEKPSDAQIIRTVKTTSHPLLNNRKETLAESNERRSGYGLSNSGGSYRRNSSTSTTTSSSRTYYDALAFDLKGHVKSCIVENNVNDSKTSKYEFKTTGEASLIIINGMRIPLSEIRRDSSKRIQGFSGFGKDEDGYDIYKYYYNSNGTLKALDRMNPELGLLFGSGFTTDYEYNSKGIVIAEKDVLRETKFNVLEVDSHNNWTKRTYKKEVYTIFGPDTETVTETRTIEYW